MFRRHAFVRLAENAWRDATPEGGDIEVLQEWTARGRPLIIRRPCVSDDGQEVFLGLALPGKRRMAFRVPVASVRAVEPPPVWDVEVVPGFVFRIYGSRAWELLTGLSYVTPSSDLDLLVDIDSLAGWRSFLSSDFQLPEPPRVDLEVIFQADASFSWREYLGPADDILIKSNRRVWLERKDQLGSLLA
ncbi:MAG: hypothetical protein BGO12_23390 [Verrucomicrobia bacterium 61-8]|nr:hypothetical protein [Verrucomicrobiota bacterium]OJV14009.1 MAG: hypothetical protein BGO12_23390 [Verrucomicrobia bacterium 61-8]